MSLMTTLLHKLPVEIVHHIIPYTYSIQNKKLLHDIQNYYDTKHAIIVLYNASWEEYLRDIAEYDANEWLINDLFAYSNNYYPGMHGFVKSFYNIFRRCLSLKKIKDIEKYVSILQKKPVNTQINIFWGLFTPEERMLFCIEKLSDHA